MTTKKNSRKELEHELRMRAYKDPVFRKQLIADPKNTMKKVSTDLGMDTSTLDHYKKIHIIEEKPGELHVSIPAPIKTNSQAKGSLLADDGCTTSCPTDYTGYCPTATT